MADTALLAGTAIRRLRRREGLTQAAMAARLSISPSYLNLLERNQRPLSARLVVQLAEQFDFDPRSLRQDEAVGGIDGLRRRLADERFADLAIDRDEIAEWLSAAPQAALAFARLYDAAGKAGADRAPDPMDLVRREIERWRNHFADLDMAAEALADELRLSSSDVGAALAERLRQKHQIAVRILPVDVMPDALRRLDLHARQLQLSEMLDPSSRNFQIALQLAALEQRDEIAAIANGAQFEDRGAWRLFRRHLTGYFAAAVLMPYGRFMRACEATGYDLGILQRRFGVGFEQLGHRLTTLQRVGQRGLPFFMARVDRAGQYSKRYAGASGALLLESDVTCPRWIAHHAFERAGQICVQLVDFAQEGGQPGQWFTMARTVEGSGALGADAARFAVILGIEGGLAGQLAQARGLSLTPASAVPIGPGCARCHRADCQQRSLPPRGAALQFDERRRGLTPFEFGG
ncbi:MAG TPA: short-chain fatty acyl-CoA regulator family protein [Novosphingobium sp.]|nr:short-chain fatty acyl-CoA regulator family protein [Novosphingobium sp.]HQQ07990.1 short-chain fatty acyl-CoA regulator family protein [Novosphingobium sp.]